MDWHIIVIVAIVSVPLVFFVAWLARPKLQPFTAWGGYLDDRPHTFIQGTDPPRYLNGATFEDCERLFFVVYARSWEEACSIYHSRQGWTPYKPF